MNEKMLRARRSWAINKSSLFHPRVTWSSVRACVWVAQTTKERRQRVKSCDGMEINVFIEIKVFNYHI